MLPTPTAPPPRRHVDLYITPTGEARTPAQQIVHGYIDSLVDGYAMTDPTVTLPPPPVCVWAMEGK